MANFPVINMEKLNGDEREQQQWRLSKMLVKIGVSFELVNHGIPIELLGTVERMTKDHYKKCMEERFKEMVAKLGKHFLFAPSSHLKHLRNSRSRRGLHARSSAN